MQNALNWFEIPVVDLERAMEFYSTVLEHKMEPMDMSPGYKGAFFPHQGGVSGALVKGEGYVPSQEGAVIYLNGGTDLAPALERVTEAGGNVIMPKTSIGEHGFVAMFTDCEGNRMALHSME